MLRKTLLVLALVSPVLTAAADPASRAADSRAAVKEFMQTLKGELQAAMKAGGPVNAIGVCSEKAPAIAASISAKYNWEVGRTSLKVRNPDNAPDAWETVVLEAFDEELAKGTPPSGIEHYEVVETEQGQVFRYMKAIPTGKVCLTCHGEQIEPPVAAKLQALYPDDRATGYKQGELRGAFTIIQPF